MFPCRRTRKTSNSFHCFLPSDGRENVNDHTNTHIRKQMKKEMNRSDFRNIMRVKFLEQLGQSNHFYNKAKVRNLKAFITLYSTYLG